MKYDISTDIIKQRVLITDALRRYTGTEVNRQNRCPCPIHNGKHSNFSVYPKSNSFFCFSCGAGGDVIKFVSLLFDIKYYDAIHRIDDDYMLGLFDKKSTTYNEYAKRSAKILQERRKKEQALTYTRYAYDRLISYFKWLKNQPGDEKIKFDIEYISRQLDKHLSFDRCPIEYDVEALIRSLYSKHKKEGGEDIELDKM